MSHDQGAGSIGAGSIFHILFFALLLLLPAVAVSMFGWVFFLVPVAVLFYRYRWRHGWQFVIAGFALAAVAGLFLSSAGLILFSATLIAAGYIAAQAAFYQNSPALSGLKATVVLISCWLLFFTTQSALTGVNPVVDFFTSLNRDIDAALTYYRQSETVTPETMALLDQSFSQMKTVLPKVFPALVASLGLLTVWATMLIGNQLIARFTAYQPWEDHQRWRLPDQLVWLLIAAGAASLVPIPGLRLIGVNVLICMSLIYIFQGFAVLSFYLHAWNVPRPLRFLLYAMMLFQSFGTILLVVIGVGDVWLDIRRLKKQSGPDDPDRNDSST